MNIPKLISSFGAIFLSMALYAQSVEKTALGVRVNPSGSYTTEIAVYSPSIIRVVKHPVSDGVLPLDNSLAVIMQPGTTKFSVRENSGAVTVRTSVLSVSIDKEDGTVSFHKGGKQLLAEKGSVRFERHTKGVDKGDYKVYQQFLLEDEEAIYGLGQMQDGRMSQRNKTKYMVQNNTEDFIPFFQSVKGYGLYWDNYSPTTFSDNEDGTSFDSVVGERLDYYFMEGGNADGVIAQMRELTGSVPMFPLWAYGFFQSKERYKSQYETVNIVRKYRELGVPLDCVVQDWQYWGNNYLWNAMDFLNDEFPNPKQMMKEIHDMNAKIIISIWASFGPQTLQFKEMAPKGMLMDFQTWPQSGSTLWPPRKKDYPSGVRVYDAYNPEARDIYWKYLNKGLFSLGMDGWWMDSTDPDHLDAVDSDLDNKTYLGSFRKVRNAFPLMSVGGVYDNQRAVSSDKRVFILTRSMFAGQQRYGANTWTGDVQAGWRVLEAQISAGLNHTLCGIPHWNSDIGGFFLGNYPKKLEDPEYRELYARWLQFGAFCPMMRSHGADAPREIWQFGKKGEAIYDSIEKFIHLRYSLLPYIYSTSWDVTSDNGSFMRALAMDFAADKQVWDINDEYMFGKAILVAPVTKYRNEVSEIYLPKGADWYDFWTNEKLAGGQTVEKQTPIDIMPLYVKAGSILPRGPKVQYSTEKPWDKLELVVYAGANGSFTLYEDEFDNYNYENGAYSEIPITWNNAKRTLTIGSRKGSYEGMIEQRQFVVSLAGGEATTVDYNGKEVKIKL